MWLDGDWKAIKLVERLNLPAAVPVSKPAPPSVPMRVFVCCVMSFLSCVCVWYACMREKECVLCACVRMLCDECIIVMALVF